MTLSTSSSCLVTFQVDIIHKDEIIPGQYTLIDVAYLYNWRKVSVMIPKVTMMIRQRNNDAFSGSTYGVLL